MTESEFTSLVNQYSERLYWHIRGIVGSHEDADDILQNVFLRAWRKSDGFRGDSSAFTWLWKIATNESLNHLRHAKVISFLTLDSLRNETAVDGVSGNEVEVALRKAIASLPPKQRAVFCMRYYEEMGYAQMSSILGTSEGALKASYHIAYEKVKKYLTD